jgi:flagellar hook-associated protein 2
MATSASTLFTGTSQFSQDLQGVVTRAVNIASLPITQLQGQVTTLQSQSSALSGIDSKFAALQTAIQNVSDALGDASSLNANVSTVNNTSVVSASVGDGALEGTYSIEVKDIGAYASSMTAASWVDQTNPSGEQHTYQLWIGDKQDPANEIDITPADNSAATVAATINAKAGDKVHATVVNVGSNDSPDYRISLQAVALGATPLDIVDGSSSLQTQMVDGAPAQYVVNNAKTADGLSPLVVTSTSRSVNISTGLTLNLLASAPDNPVTITLSRSPSALSNALASFASAYDAAVNALDQQHGNAQGALAGQSVVNTLGQTLSSLATYTVPGSQIGGLKALGLDLDKTGQLTFTPANLTATAASNYSGITAFLGSATGGGFLKTATDALNGVEDATSGIIKTAESSTQDEITRSNNQISTKQDQVDQLQQNLQQQMAAADALIASMEQQYSYLSNMFQAMATASQQYK